MMTLLVLAACLTGAALAQTMSGGTSGTMSNAEGNATNATMSNSAY
ncbi:MAG: hypothetical protein KGJ11_09955 [Candidatus Omnitrophica bacterium]|nr:hypothetical protein [Candidatus Omnitrophota bacterium]